VGDPVGDLVLIGELEPERVTTGDRVPVELLETEVVPVGERECVVEPVAVFDAELVRVPEGLPETDLVALVVVLLEMVTVGVRLSLGETELLTEGVVERDC
jgi:hypothetical protein